MKKILLFFYSVISAAVFAAQPIPIRGVTWQWCYIRPELDFCLQTVDAMADAGYNAIMPEFGPLPENAGKIAPTRARISREEYRKILQRAKQRNMLVIPLMNTCGHSDRSIAWPVRLNKEMDLGSEDNYKLLFQVIDDLKADFKAVGIDMPYINLGMDEASASLLANAKKYGKTPAVLLEQHIRKVYDFCKSRNLRLIIYHDMLIGKADPIYDKNQQYIHADKTGSWTCRKNIPRDIIIMYWDYEPHNSYGVVDALGKEGFEVWLMPWGRDGMRAMVKYAASKGLKGIIGSTWMETSFSVSAPPHPNHAINNPWIFEALEETAFVCSSSDWAKELTYDPAFRFITRYFPVPAGKFNWNSPAGTTWQGAEKLQVLPGVNKPVLLGAWPSGKDNLDQLQMPLKARTSAGKEIPVNGVNTGRGANQLVLYTPVFGASTKCNGYGTEAVIRDGKLVAKTTWGVGNSSIPRNGFVLSGHNSAAVPLNKLKLDIGITIVDANGTVYGPVAGENGDVRAVFPVKGKKEQIAFLWATAQGSALSKQVMGEVICHYSDKSTAVSPLMYGRDFFAWDAPGFYWGKRKTHTVWYASSYSSGRNSARAMTGWCWKNPHPDKSLVSVEVKLTEAGIKNGLVIAGWSAK